MTTVGEFCNRRVVYVRKTDSVLEAARRMLAQHVGSVVVLEEEDGKRLPMGMLTDRDIVVAMLANDERKLDALRVADVITTELVRAWEDESLYDALKRMRSFGIRRLPVVDRNDELQGLIAFDDIIEFVSEQMNDLATLLSREQAREREQSAPPVAPSP